MLHNEELHNLGSIIRVQIKEDEMDRTTASKR
jgi:hypothetical protein